MHIHPGTWRRVFSLLLFASLFLEQGAPAGCKVSPEPDMLKCFSKNHGKWTSVQALEAAGFCSTSAPVAKSLRQVLKCQCSIDSVRQDGAASCALEECVDEGDKTLCVGGCESLLPGDVLRWVHVPALSILRSPASYKRVKCYNIVTVWSSRGAVYRNQAVLRLRQMSHCYIQVDCYTVSEQYKARQQKGAQVEKADSTHS